MRLSGIAIDMLGHSARSVHRDHSPHQRLNRQTGVLASRLGETVLGLAFGGDTASSVGLIADALANEQPVQRLRPGDAIPAALNLSSNEHQLLQDQLQHVA